MRVPPARILAKHCATASNKLIALSGRCDNLPEVWV
jgi:hypothetical protein